MYLDVALLMRRTQLLFGDAETSMNTGESYQGPLPSLEAQLSRIVYSSVETEALFSYRTHARRES